MAETIILYYLVLRTIYGLFLAGILVTVITIIGDQNPSFPRSEHTKTILIMSILAPEFVVGGVLAFIAWALYKKEE